jgi:hypothetical protein
MDKMKLSNDDLIVLINGLYERIDRLQNTDLGLLQNNREYIGDNIFLTELNKLINIRNRLISEFLYKSGVKVIDL